jgi:hypothetical protein
MLRRDGEADRAVEIVEIRVGHDGLASRHCIVMPDSSRHPPRRESGERWMRGWVNPGMAPE